MSDEQEVLAGPDENTDFEPTSPVSEGEDSATDPVSPDEA